MLVLIPARGGSKRVVGKNVRSLGGKPLIVHTIEAARAAFSNSDATIWVSTDSHEIADVARQAGAEVPFERPRELATAGASSVDVALHALDEYEQKFQMSPGVMMLLQPTSPFRRVEHLQQSIQMLESDSAADAVVGVHRAHVPAGFVFTLEGTQLLSLTPEKLHGEPVYLPNGAVYTIRACALREQKTFYAEHTLALAMSAIESLDIDTEDDWQLAEALFDEA